MRTLIRLRGWTTVPVLPAHPLNKSLDTYRHNEMGTPYRVIADAGMLESGVVGLQDRDTTIQVCHFKNYTYTH